MSKLFRLKEDYTPHPFRWWHIPLLLLLIGGTIYIARDARTAKHEPTATSKPFQRNEGAVFGTFYHMTYAGDMDMQPLIDSVLAEVDRSLSPFNPKSVITAINENASAETDARFRYVFRLAQRISTETEGAFDITCAPLVNAWGFGFKHAADVDSVMIDSILQFVGYDKIALNDKQVVKKDDRMMLDCSAIAKGYGVDAVTEMFDAHGIDSYMVEIGGEVRVKGTNPQGETWRIGINKPTDDPTNTNDELQDIISISDIAMATSGNYRNYYEKDRKRYAHTIDPRTGYPVQHSVLSATVLAPDCATADAYATAFMVMGLEQAQALLATKTELKAYLIYADGEGNNCVWHSKDLNLQPVE